MDVSPYLVSESFDIKLSNNTDSESVSLSECTAEAHCMVHGGGPAVVDANDRLPSGISTLFEAFQHAVKTYPNNPHLAYREYISEKNSFSAYKYITYEQSERLARSISNFMLGLTYEIKEVAICLPSCYQAALVDLAAQMISFPTRFAQAASWEAENPFVVFTNLKNVEDFLEVKQAKFVVVIDSLDSVRDHEIFMKAADSGVTLMDWGLFIMLAQKSGNDMASVARDVVPSPESVYTYWNDAAVTHKNSIGSLSNFLCSPESDNIHYGFSCLPLADLQERFNFHLCTFKGYTYYFPHSPGSPITFHEDLRIANLTFGNYSKCLPTRSLFAPSLEDHKLEYLQMFGFPQISASWWISPASIVTRSSSGEILIQDVSIPETLLTGGWYRTGIFQKAKL